MKLDTYHRWVVGWFNISFVAITVMVSFMWLATIADRLLGLKWGWDRQIIWIAPIILLGAIIVRSAYSDEAGHLFRREAGHRTDLKPAIIPTRSRPFEGGPCGSSGLIS